MTKKIYYINNNGILKRKNNTIYFIRKNGDIRIHIPVEKIHTIMSFGKLTISSGAISLISKKKITMHFFNKYGVYQSCLSPIKISQGEFLVKQLINYLDHDKRMNLARKFVQGCGKNMISNLKFYKNKGKNLEEEIKQIQNIVDNLNFERSIEGLLSYEGDMWNKYYKSFNKILPNDFNFVKRTRNPPKDMINCLISYGNSVLYSTILSEIYKTELNPSISFLHSPSRSRFSLVFDISEIFKPLIVDRTIFKIVNQGILNKEHFNYTNNGVFLNSKGREIFINFYEKRLYKKIFLPRYKRKISYRNIIREECYKILRHIIGREIYEPFMLK